MKGYQQEYNRLSPMSTLSEEDFLITLLTSLPDSWNNFIAAIDSTALADSQRLIACILEEDHCLRSKNPDQAITLTARDKKGEKKYNPNVTYYKCGKKGHTRPDCRSPKQDDRENQERQMS